MNADEKKFMKAIVRKVHPDLFASHQYERQKNSESLKSLNNYVDHLSRGLAPPAATLEFYIKNGDRLSRVDSKLGCDGSLGPLFLAFGLITEDQLDDFISCSRSGSDDTNFLEWLKDTVDEAVRIAEQHESLRQRTRELRASLEYRYRLASLQCGSEYAIKIVEQQRQIEALKVLDTCLGALQTEEGWTFDGLNIHLYHPENTPLGTYSFVDGSGNYNFKTTRMRSYVADDGSLHVVADRVSIKKALRSMDLERARVLTQVTMFWLKRVRDLTPILKEVLRVDNLWCDTRSEQNSQNFVLWAGYVLEQRDEIRRVIGRRRFAFSMLVHSDQGSPMVDFSPSSSILQVRSDCPPSKLMEFLCSDSGLVANEAAERVAVSKREEQHLLEEIRTAFGAKHVVRVCSMYEQEKVLDGARRLLQNAEVIKKTVDLNGASIAIDDCYEVWGSGFISIPYDFKLQELRPKLARLLEAGKKAKASRNGLGYTSGSYSSTRSPATAVARASWGGKQNRVGVHLPMHLQGHRKLIRRGVCVRPQPHGNALVRSGDACRRSLLRIC